MTTSLPPRTSKKQWLFHLAFIGVYVFLDWISYIEPLFGLNITPWNPDPALGLVYWIRFGKRAALPWYAALLISELCVRGLPAGALATFGLSAWLVLGYGLTGELLRRKFADVLMVDSRARLFAWLKIAVSGLALTGLGYIVLLSCARLIPDGALGMAIVRYAVGDIVGVVVSMPLVWMLSSSEGRRRLSTVANSWETPGYLALAALAVWGVFYGLTGSGDFRHFYFLFLPIIWAATRHGLPGTGLVAFVLQFGIILVVRWGQADSVPFAELQQLGLALALVGFFIGVMVDEQRQAADELKQSLRLAAAGEMAAALAHELNQPMTALAAYGKACEHLVARGDTGVLLTDTIGKMVREAGRAADVVRRLREFFRTGAMHLESTRVADIVAAISEKFEPQCREHQVRLDVQPMPDLAIRADRLQIELVLRNLIANAFDAVLTQPAHQRRISVSGDSLPDGRFRMSVEDSGPGVSKAIVARLFEPFVSGKSSGLGLGLVLSRAIVEAHGGSLWAEIGERGVFRFILPLMEPGAEHVA